MAGVVVATAGSLPHAAAQDANNVFRWTGDGLRLELAALSGEQVEAFFIGRGFEVAAAALIAAEGCVFRSDVGHLSDQPDATPVTVDLSTWQIIAGETEHTLRTRADWAPVWRQRNVEPGPRTAFKWALFPTRQTFGPGDYNWGMITFGRPPGTRFDLKIRWQMGQATHEAVLTGLECAP